MRLLLIIIISILPVFLNAQNYSDTVRASVGDELTLRIQFQDSVLKNGINNLEANIYLTNPTVFYPDSINLSNDFIITNDSLSRITDSLWYFNIEFQKDSNSTFPLIFTLSGEALAGTDSSCVVNHTNIRLNNKPIKDINILIITNPDGFHSHYYRFSKLEQNFPNPVKNGEDTKWHYNLDKPSVVEFYIIDYRGKETYLTGLGEQSFGIHEYIFTPGMGYSSGLYWMKLKTNSGESLQPFVIVK